MKAQPSQGLSTIDGVSDPGITLNVHNYNQSSINQSHALKFGPTDGKEGNTFNSYTGAEKGVWQGIVQRKLDDDGYPQLSRSLTGNTESLAYLFNGKTSNVDSRMNVQGLFQKDADGYYEYDSMKNFASLTKENGQYYFKLYNQSRFPYASEPPSQPGAFLPLNDLATDWNGNGVWDGTNDRWTLADNKSDDYYFGMGMSASFYMPKDRKINGKDMVFEFEGDDDVWVFIDDVLVLDIGGIHDNYSGSINFNTGEVTVEKVFKNGNQPSGWEQKTSLDDLFRLAGETWDGSDYSQHTISFFYLERGAGGSNCKLRFNLPTVPSDVIDVGKAITDSNTDDFSRAEFTMRVEVSDTKNGTYEPYVGSYDLYESNELVKEGLTTNNDGTFTLRNGQFARLTGGEGGFSATSYYKVYELTADNYDKGDYKFDLSETDMVDDSGAIQSGLIGQSNPIMVGDVNHITVRNKFKAKSDKYTFTVSKRLASGTAPDQQFELKVTNGEGTPYTGKYYLRTDSGLGNDPKQVTTDGVIKLEAGQDAVIMNVAPGTTFKVEEVNLPSGYLDPTYSCSTNAAQPCYSVTVDNANRKPSVTVTNTPAPMTYGTNAHLKLHKQLENQDLKPDMFKFKLELVTQPNEGAITLPEVKAVPNGDANGNDKIDDDETDGTVFDFGDITFAEAGTYVLKVTESQEAEAPSQGGRYSFDNHVLYVRYTIGQNSETGALEIQKREVAKTDEMDPDLEQLDWQDATGENFDEAESFVDEYLTWHNTYVAPVSSLPLTGGRSTARTLLLTGGGVLLVAGAAWLLARRRQV